MPNNLALTITMAAAAGGAAAVFGNIKTTIQRITVATSALKERQRELGREMKANANAHPIALERINAQYERQGRLIERLNQQTKALNSTQARMAAEQQKRGELRGKIMGMAAMGFVAAQPIRTGIEFSKSMSKVQALTRLDKDSEEMKALRAQARELGATTSFTASEAAQGQAFLAMAGFRPDQILKSMPAMLDLAKAGGIDLQRTADIASNIQTAMGLTAEDMPRIADTLTMAFTTSNVDMDMLSESMKYVAPVAKAANMSLAETAAITGMLGNAGIQGSMAGTTLKNTLNNLASPSSKAAKALKNLGVKTKDARGNLRSLPDILGDVAKATEKMGTADKLALASTIFGIRASTGNLALIENADKIKPYIDMVKDSEGTAARTAKTMTDNLGGDLVGLKSIIEELGLSLFDTAEGPLRELSQSTVETLRGVSEWTKENQELVAGIVKFLAVLFALKAGFLIAGYGISLLTSGVLKFIAVFQRAKAAILIFKALGMKAAFFSLVSPVGLVVAAIVALAAAAYLIYKNWEPIKAFFGGIWDSIAEFASSGIGNITATILNWSPLGLFYKALAGVLSLFGVELPEKFTEFGSQMLNGLIKGMESVPILGSAIKIASGTIDAVKNTLGISSPSKVFAEMGGFTMQGLSDGLRASAGLPLAALKSIAGTLAAAGSITMAGGMTPALAAPMGGSAGGATYITLHVHPSAGMDEKALADLVVRKIAEANRTAEASRRSRLSDTD
jgi:TP901 family phage tail tape measure protein